MRRKLAKAWQDYDLSNLASEPVRQLRGVRGDWDPPMGITPRREPVRLAIGIPDGETIPYQALIDATSEAVNRYGESGFIYGFGMGYPGLREQLAARYVHRTGLTVDEDWFQLTNGSAGAIDLMCRATIDPGDVIIAESPTYMGTLRNFRGVLADIRSVPMDADGIDLTALEKLIQKLEQEGRRIKFIYTISTFQNPTGATLSLRRRRALLELAARHQILILDDDAYGELYYGDMPPDTLAGLSGGFGVITVGTFSKILATGLRVGWIMGSPELLQMIGSMRFAMGLNQLIVRTLAVYMESGALDEHVVSVRQLYRKKMNVLADALEHHAGGFVSFTRPDGGFYLWAGLDGIRSEDVWRTAAQEGVGFTPGTNFFPAREDHTGEHIRLAFPWTPENQLVEGARRIGLACERVAGGDIA